MVPFPFSDLSEAKLRPTVVLAHAGRDDWILCQVTSKSYGDPRAIALTDAELDAGSLRTVSYVRPGKLFTADRELMVMQVGRVRMETFRQILDAVVDMFLAGIQP